MFVYFIRLKLSSINNAKLHVEVFERLQQLYNEESLMSRLIGKHAENKCHQKQDKEGLSHCYQMVNERSSKSTSLRSQALLK